MKSDGRIHTTHVGSLVRAPELVELLTRINQGDTVEPSALEGCIDRTVAQVVAKQVETGIDIVDDGEYGKFGSWAQYIAQRLNGLELRSDAPPDLTPLYASRDRRDFAEFYAEYEAQNGIAGMGKQARPSAARAYQTVVAPVTYRPEAVKKDIARLKAAMSASGAKAGFLPVVAPVSAVALMGNLYYATHEELLFAVADALHEEYKIIVDAGLDVQIDDAFLASNYDGMVPPKTLEEYRAWTRQGVEALNHALRGIPDERVRYHVCWGSWNGPHSHDVPAADIVDLILSVRAAGYSLEMANPRHEHEWQIWKTTKLPDGKVLLPGVVTHSTNIVEHPELVAERIERLARLVGRENVIASTDCGFAQGPFARRVHPSIQWAKLASLVAGARLASDRLWRA